MNEKYKNFISVVAYTHDDAVCIKEWMLSINKWLKLNFNRTEIIFVNDFSKDATREIIKTTASMIDPSVTVSVIDMSYFHGVESAMSIGTELSIGDFVFEFDSVFMDYSLDVLNNAFEKVLEGNDIIGVSPCKKARINQRIFYSLVNKYSKSNYNVSIESFRVLSRRAINRVHDQNRVIVFRQIAYANTGLLYKHLTYTPILQKNIEHDMRLKNYYKKLYLDTILINTNLVSGILRKISFGIAFCTGMTSFALLFKRKRCRNEIEFGFFLSIIIYIFFLITRYQELEVSQQIKNKNHSYMNIEKFPQSEVSL